MTLAIFDLDNTLIAGDSDHAWGEFLVEQGIVDQQVYKKANDQFYQDYLDGKLDMMRYLEFSLAPLAAHTTEQLLTWRANFVETKIRPLLLTQALELLQTHRQQGDYLLIITATNRFVTEPIAELLGVDALIATDPEIINGQYTGKIVGTPSFQHGKVTRLEQWLNENRQSLSDSWFYSDSHNDLPLLQQVDRPVAVDPDQTLFKYASEQGWPIISLRK
ncbi:MAG: HAD family hydrolase [Hahellaceae bacterium]|nr:HAD family hydrolase [Hahellaceae bacterium]MCP5168666.1 HAD family hydrolase [Hahellaceae bacterium]